MTTVQFRAFAECVELKRGGRKRNVAAAAATPHATVSFISGALKPTLPNAARRSLTL
jgi:hypothetical protein